MWADTNLGLHATYFNASLPCLGVDNESDGKWMGKKVRLTDREKEKREKIIERKLQMKEIVSWVFVRLRNKERERERERRKRDNET